MKENTRITTIQITEICKEPDEVIDTITAPEAKAIYKGTLADVLKENLQVDDVVVTNVQDFVRG